MKSLKNKSISEKIYNDGKLKKVAFILSDRSNMPKA
jgi:hypothetical protein